MNILLSTFKSLFFRLVAWIPNVYLNRCSKHSQLCIRGRPLHIHMTIINLRSVPMDILFSFTLNRAESFSLLDTWKVIVSCFLLKLDVSMLGT